ncbi:MAG TPA: MerR family transcriptional regulator [Streptosporangiaceae bacterium]|nr:MerR family transcriptional regulator [Streptosporangiaceae bacterium]
MSSGRPVYSIGAVAEILSVPAATLRTWQERYGVVEPERSPAGHRLYSRDQLENLRFLADQVAGGLSPGDAHRLLGERLARGTAGPEDRDGDTPLILLAERDPHAADFAEYFLRTEGYEVVVAMDADAALVKAGELTPDLIKVDLLISGARGLELCRQLRARLRTPILAICTLELRDAALDAGASAFLQRPVEPLHLVSAVKDLLGRSAFIRRGVASS